MISDVTESEMTSVVAALRKQCDDGRREVLSFWNDSAAQQAMNGSLDQLSHKIDDLDGRLRDDVRNNALAIERWRAIAQTTQDGIASIAGYSIGWSDFWNDVAVKTGSDVKTQATDAADTVKANLPLYIGIAGAFLLLILAIKVT